MKKRLFSGTIAEAGNLLRVSHSPKNLLPFRRNRPRSGFGHPGTVETEVSECIDAPFGPAIAWRVAPQQSPPPFHRTHNRVHPLGLLLKLSGLPRSTAAGRLRLRDAWAPNPFPPSRHPSHGSENPGVWGGAPLGLASWRLPSRQ